MSAAKEWPRGDVALAYSLPEADRPFDRNRALDRYSEVDRLVATLREISGDPA
ncbi:MAG: hypothetical protein ACOYNI_04320 [Acidimicrobiia bacterium]